MSARDHVIAIRVTSAEGAQIAELARLSGMTTAAYVRVCALPPAETAPAGSAITEKRESAA